MKDTDNRSPEEIESDIARTRADFSSTIDAIQHKLSPSEMMDQAVDYALSTTPGAFSMNLVNSVRDNPIPVALIGIGIAWLMASGRQSGGAGGYQRSARPMRRSALGAYDTGYEGIDDREYLAARDYGAGESDPGLMQRMASKTSDATQGVKETASNVGQKLSDTASSVTGRVQQASQSARARLGETAGSAQARMSEMGRRSQVQVERMRNRVGEMVDEQPFVLGAVGLAVGAALGAAFPTTRRENEMMGGVRDDLLERAKETAREQAETLKQSAQRIADTAKQEGQRVADDVSTGAMQRQGQDQGAASTTAAGTGGSQFGGTSGSSSIH
ncbi:MAG TPA: DUF3618 domain-containing protein [Noviherbaspirillum sp.]|uniref:DUF3618 domain-containing protein n=1 Tax=Noviherbaspirillum sp. TaxID=1926288 RepID=UPI002D4B5EE9|nr:DUF3618 domain-containing protein [Noviherbaspirillum sp.]HYD94127.1 DUF3618 domain-containing protein [Noviherbaspirillum sp.]